MKKLVKNLVSILIVLSILFSTLSISVFASDIKVIETEKVIVVNEWDEYQRIVSMSDSELISSGFALEEIAEIRAFDYEEEIRKTAALTDETLTAYGYTTEEIIELRQVASMEEIPENVIQAISSSTMTTKLSFVKSGSRVEAGKTMYYSEFIFSWKWSRIPIFRVIDMVAIAFASSTSDQFTYYATSSNKVHADLKALASGDTKEDQVVSWVYSSSKPNSISAKFYTCMKNSGGAVTHFAYSGYGFFQLTNRSKNARLYVDASYGHTTLNITPSYSLNGSGLDLSVDFCLGMDEQHCTGYYYENFTISRNYVYDGLVYGRNSTGGAPIS